MKPYDSLKEAKKSLIRQVAVLIAVVILISLVGRIMDLGHFRTDFVLDYLPDEINQEDVAIVWDGGQIPVEDYKVGRRREGNVQARVMHIDMRPDKPGDYAFDIVDKDGKLMWSDVVYVGPFGGAYSWASGSFTGDEAFIFAGIMGYVILSVIMVLFYRRLKGPLAYSYEAILSCGVLLFSIVALLIEIPVYIRHLITPELYPTLQVMTDIAAGGRFFVIFSSPVIVVLGLLLMISNIALLRHERPRFQNVLGLLLGVLMIVSVLGYILWYQKGFAGSYQAYRVQTLVENVLGIVVTYMECALLGSVFCGLRAARHVPARDRDYILILGCGFRKDGTLPPLLRGRVDRALEFWRKQKRETGKEAMIIPSGGQGGDEPMAEAEAMYRYIVGTGFPENLVIKEDRSANTYQNMEFSRKIIESREEDPSRAKVAFSTTNYHVFRSGVWAGLAGLKAEGMGSRTKWWFWPNAFVRECVGLFQNRIVPEMVLLVILIAVFGLVTWLSQ